MKLRQIAIAATALSMAGVTFAAGNQAATNSSSSSDTNYSAQPQAQQAGTSASEQGSAASAQQSQSTGAAAAGHSDPSLVRSVQQALKDKGFDAGPIDGQMGPSTQSALRNFQQAQSLPQSGDLDEQTLSALGVSPSGAMSQAAPGATSMPSQSTAPDRASSTSMPPSTSTATTPSSTTPR